MKDTESIKAFIRNHPRSIPVFEAFFGYAFWNRLDAKVSELCVEFQQDEAALRRKLSLVAEAPANPDWTAQPIVALVDYLTTEHGHFKTQDLPTIHKLLDECRLKYGLEKPEWMDLERHFHDFRLGFINHMEEEEDFLFIKILRTEASLKYPQLYPEVFKGSVSMYPPSLLLSSEAEVAEMISSILSKAENISDKIQPGWEGEPLLKALQSFDSAIKAHADLEVQVLLPRAKAMEAELKHRA